MEKTKGEEVAKGVLGGPRPHVPTLIPVGPEVAGAQGKGSWWPLGWVGWVDAGTAGGKGLEEGLWVGSGWVGPGPGGRGWADHNNNVKNYNNNSFSIGGALSTPQTLHTWCSHLSLTETRGGSC